MNTGKGTEKDSAENASAEEENQERDPRFIESIAQARRDVSDGRVVRHEQLKKESSMGEIREKVRLTNAFEMELAQRGMMPRDKVRSVEVDAVVDTGAVTSVLPVHIVDQLGIGIRGHRAARYADGRNESVPVTNAVLFECQTRSTIEEGLVLGDEVLIGQTVLEKLDLLADCNKQKLIPHPDRPNQPVSMVRGVKSEV
jgi:clan AA aspartic protease